MRRRLGSGRILSLVLVACLVIAMQPSAGAAAPLARTTAQLAAADPSQDGASVAFVGEAIGEALRAGKDHVWVNVLSDATAIGVYAARDQAAGIRIFGDYARNGDRVEVVGTFNVACDRHGGDLDVHARTLRVVSGGSGRVQHIPAREIIAAVVLGAMAAGIWAYSVRRRSRQRV